VGGTGQDPLPAIPHIDDGSPARGIVVGLILSVVGFWAPVAIIAARFASK